MSERKKRIEEAASKFNWQGVVNRLRTSTKAFKLGAEWADANPLAPSQGAFDESEISKLYRKVELNCHPSYSRADIFRAGWEHGRAGMVPVGEVELLQIKLKKQKEEEDQLMLISKLHCDQQVAIAVKQERERVIKRLLASIEKHKASEPQFVQGLELAIGVTINSFNPEQGGG